MCDGGRRVRFAKDGRLAQLGEHHVRNVGVVGSNPMPSTKYPRYTTIPHPEPSGFTPSPHLFRVARAREVVL